MTKKKATKRSKKPFNYRHIICIIITLGFVAVGAFVFPNTFGRTIESFRDFGLSIGYFFAELFKLEHEITPTVAELAKIPFFDVAWVSSPLSPLPDTWAGFQASWGAYWRLWATLDNFLGYLDLLGNIMFWLFMAVLIALPLLLFVYFIFNRYFKKQNNNYNKDSKPLRAFKWLAAHTYRPVRRFVTELCDFIRNHRAYWIAWLCMWLWYFNALTIAVELVAYYFFFMASFDVGTIYRQVYKLFIDLAVPFGFIPLWVWVILALILFDRFRKRIALSVLQHYEMRNRGFINARPIVFMTCGTMGKKKTTAITDMALSQEIMFRDKAFEKLLENDLKFPYFPWINFENEIKRAMSRRSVYNLAMCRRFVQSKQRKFFRLLHHGKPLQARLCLFDYDYNRYGYTFDDKLKVVDIWNVLETYAQLYFIYVIQSSLLISNYSIRTDSVLADMGNFPMWDSDFFGSDSRLIDSYSRHAHILDFDTLRLGRKVIEDNDGADSFEFGVVCITEIGKERGNKTELEGKRKTDESTNQKNDLFNSWLKMVRHSATVDNFPFVRVITDEQRPESWGADARDLCEIVHIRESGETQLAMPFFSLGELLYSLVFSRFVDLYYRYRFVRSDNTLPLYLLKAAVARLRHYYDGIYNRFGYCVLYVQTENGTQDGEISEHKYYLMNKKIYSKRFSTDCFSDFFTAKALRSQIGIDDLPEYETEKASFDELQQQNSYFVNDLLNGLRRGKDN